jgi:glucose-1-phosphatase
MNTSLTAIIFDLGGVVLNIDYNRCIEEFKKLGEEHFEELYTKSHQDKIFDQLEMGKISAADFRAYMKKFLHPSVPPSEIDRAWNALLLDLPKHRIDLLLELKKKYRIYLFSNTNEIHMEGFRKIIGKAYGDPDLLEKVFHKTYYSHLIGLRKPHPEAFRHILHEQGLKPAETLFIDDSIQHIEGASSIGIQTIHLVNKDISEVLPGLI